MVSQQIQNYFASLPEPKRTDMMELHTAIMQLLPGCKLWFFDGKNAEKKVVSNPNIGYGSQLMKYADGSSKEFYQIGISANTSGISVYIMGIDDRKLLARTFGPDIGKASISGYCIKFRHLQDVNFDVLKRAILFGAGK